MRSRTVIILGIGLLLLAMAAVFMLLSRGDAPPNHGQGNPTEPRTPAASPQLSTPTALPAATETGPLIFPPQNTVDAIIGESPSTGSDAGESPEEEFVEIASVPLVVRDVSGQQIGEGTVRYFAPENIQYPNSARIELEIEVDTLYITPAPDDRSPVPFITATPRPGQATPTERVPSYEGFGLLIAQRMGASLICLPERFSGCEEAPDVSDAKIVDIENGARWSWIVAPKEGVSGLQDMLLQLWTLQTVNDGPEQPNIVWMHSFQIQVGDAAATSADNDKGAGAITWLAILIGSIVLGGLMVGGMMAWRRVQSPASQPSVFISYQRKTGWATARTIHDRLAQMGAEVFIDVDDINEGRFATIIENAIQQSDYFVPVLAPGTLESEWVQREIAAALRLNKTVIPVLVSGFMLENLPPEIADLSTHNAVTITPEYFEAAMEKLARCVGLGEA